MARGRSAYPVALLPGGAIARLAIKKASQHRTRLIHWNVARAEERATRLRASGYEVDFTPLVDLSRILSQGRDLGIWLRKTKATRNVPIVFVDGDRKTVIGVKKHLTWSGLKFARRKKRQ